MRIDTGTDELLCEIRERVGTVTLNRPHKKNSLSDALTPALREVLLTLEAHPDAGCVLLTGAGDAFCSGGDVSGMGARPTAESQARTLDDHVADLIRRQEFLTLRLYELAKPTVASPCPGQRRVRPSRSRWHATCAWRRRTPSSSRPSPTSACPGITARAGS